RAPKRGNQMTRIASACQPRGRTARRRASSAVVHGGRRPTRARSKQPEKLQSRPPARQKNGTRSAKFQTAQEKFGQRTASPAGTRRSPKPDGEHHSTWLVRPGEIRNDRRSADAQEASRQRCK